MKELIPRIMDTIKREPWRVEAYEDLFGICKEIEETDYNLAHKTSKELREHIISALRLWETDVPRLHAVYKNTLLFDAKGDLDSYLLYLELNRKPEERFYQPRRKILKRVVDALQELVDGDLDELFISMPPRVGKTTLLMFFLTWLIGRDSEKSNLYSAFSDIITQTFYRGVLEVITDPYTYTWQEVFPFARLVSTNAANETINIDRQKRYPSLTCRSLYGTLNGACDCSGMLIADDLIGGIEEALNKSRLKSAWDKVDNNLIPRAKETAKILWVGTRWSLVDPAGIRMDLVQNEESFKNHRYKIINLPAMDENDESNFDYDYGVGFSTEFYRKRRTSFERASDMASWNAQYMGEPIERDGALFNPSDFAYYNGLLPEEPSWVYIPVDPAYGGGDYVSAPCLVQIEDKVYVPEVVFDNGDRKVTQPRVAQMCVRNKASNIRVEGTKSTSAYKDGLEEELKKLNYPVAMTSKAAGPVQSKVDRIMAVAPDMRETYVFLEPGKRSAEYERFLQNLFSFTIVGKNKHDDAPDSLAMGIDMLKRPKAGSIFKRPF